MSCPWITRFSSRSARGRRMMGFRRARCLNLSRDLRGIDNPPVPDSQRDHLAHRPHGNDVGSASSGGNCKFLSSRCHSLLAPAERGLVDPHAVQDDRQLARDRNPSARHAAPLRYLHAPGPQRGPFRAADQQRVGRFVECRARQLVAAAADPAEKGREEQNTAVTILHIRGMHHRMQQQTYRVDQNMPLLPFDLLARVVPGRIDAGPPFSALFTLWLSITQAVGLASRPIASRHCSYSA